MSETPGWNEFAARAFEPETPRWPTPRELAEAIDHETVQTPALDLIDRAVVDTWRTPHARLIISMPPQEGKSQRVTRTSALWQLTHSPNMRLGIVSYAQPLAEGFSRDVRNWIADFDGTDGTLDLGLRIARDNGSVRKWQLEGHRGGIIAVGVSSGITGRSLDGLIIDDPFKDDEQADSAYYRNKVWTKWQSTWSTRLSRGAPVIVIMTRWHEDDLVGRLLAAEDGKRWRVLNIPALADHDPGKGQSDPLGRQPGQWLESARGRTAEEWEAIRIQAGPRVFNALYQGRPAPAAGNVWQRPWWRFYERMLWSLGPEGSYRIECDELIQSWDMAFKDTSGSDFVVGTVWARRGADIFLVDKIRKRLTFTDTLTAVAALTARWPEANAKLVEEKANGAAVINTLKSKIPGIVAINPTESKLSRANAVAPFIRAGNVFLPSPRVTLPDVDPDSLVDEAAGFPNGAHDDQVDATSQALAYLLLDGNGFAAWLEYVKRLAAKAAGAASETAPQPATEAAPDEGHAPQPQIAPAPADQPGPQPEPAPQQPEDDVARRRAARTAAMREMRP